MKNRISLALATLLFIAISLPVFVAAQNQGSSVSPSKPSTGSPSAPTTTRRPRSSTSTRLPSDATANTEQDFAEALTIIQENYIDGNKLDYNAVFKSSIIGMLRSLDPHSNYYDREEFDEMKTDQRSEYFGIGASIGNQRKGDQTETYILATFEGSPAARAGLVFGDRILEVNGEKMSGRPSLEVRDRIRGPRGSVVKITVERASNGRTETVEITRDAVAQPSIPDSYFLRPGVAYIDMTRGFNYTTSDELEEKLEDLRAKGMTSLVLDLRNNPGGFLDQAVRVASKFLQRGQLILTQKGRNDQRPYRANNDNGADTTPLVILVNSNTASASEIVAGAMQDHDRALIVGETSFGKGLVQGIWPLEYGAGLTLTSAKYYTPSGRLIQRDYSNGGFYDYYTRGGSTRLDQKDESAAKPTGPESRTDTGRAVYGGGGIAPDEVVKPRTISPVQTRLLNPLFFFTRELVNGRVSGFDQYRVARVIDFNRELQPTDYPVTDALYKAFKDYLSSDPAWKPLAAALDRNRSFVELQLRYNIITAAYGSVRAARVFITTDDPQVARGIDALPRARELATNALRAARKEP
ncbi:MAG TPA: S41 family peptidase [Pyrinomonadaceae bacterium]|nr:S41 family peptidase [Pyrinomonadaceae bacterium]